VCIAGIKTCRNLYYIFVCRVECYIKFGWDHLLVDPDKGLNSQRKLSNLASEKMELDSVRSKHTVVCHAAREYIDRKNNNAIFA